MESVDHEAQIRFALSASLQSADLHDALQVIADGIRRVARFDIAAVSVLHEQSNEYEYIAIAGPDEAIRSLIGEFYPAHELDEKLSAPEGETWGRFVYLPPEAHGTDLSRTWAPNATYPDVPDAWHLDSFLMAPLMRPDGQVCGLLSVDVPANGRIPDEETRRILNLYAEQADVVLARALDREQLRERVRLAGWARGVVRRASAGRTALEILEECRGAIESGFNVEGIWLQTLRNKHRESLLTDPTGQVVRVPEYMVSIADDVARECWREQSVALIAPHRYTQLLGADQRETVLNFMSSLGIKSILLVPIGVGEECLGNLVMTRSQTFSEWTDPELEAARSLGFDLGQALANARSHQLDQEIVRRLEELDVYKGELISTMAHELKSPLTSIRGHLELLEDAEIDDNARRSLVAISRSSMRLRQIAENLLTLSRSELGGPIGDEDVDLRQRVREAVEMLRVQAEAKQITVKTAMPSQPVHVRGSSDDFDIVLTNLISNAIKYSPVGEFAQVSLNRLSGQVVLSVTDHGFGISADDQARLFDEFFRSASPDVRAESGTGLGLAIVKRLVDRYAGKIEVDSAAGKGTTFTICWPASS